MFTLRRQQMMGPRCPRIGQRVPWRIVAIRKRSALAFSGRTEPIREMMMIGRRKIKRNVMVLSYPVLRRGGPATHANRFHMTVLPERLVKMMICLETLFHPIAVARRVRD